MITGQMCLTCMHSFYVVSLHRDLHISETQRDNFYLFQIQIQSGNHGGSSLCNFTCLVSTFTHRLSQLEINRHQ